MTAPVSIKHRLANAVRKQLIARPNRQHFLNSHPGPIVVAGLFSTGSGIGQSARSCYRALIEAGIECLALDLSPKFNQVDLISDIPTIDALPKERQGTVILHLNGPETQHGLYQSRLLFGRNWRVIGYWAWELLEPPTEWAAAAGHLSEIWTPSEFVRASISPIVDIPIRVVPHYVSVPSSVSGEQEIRNPAKDGLKFLAMADGFSSFHRKNIFGAIEAYKNAFPEKGKHKLVIKCRNLEKYSKFNEELQAEISKRDDIELLSRTLLESDLWTLLRSIDVVVSLHRAEGFGLHLAEAMALGKVVVATNWSGNLSFMTPNNSMLVPSRLVPLTDPTGIYSDFEGALWAEASIEDASEKLRVLAENDETRRRIGNQAKADISSQLSPRRYLEALMAGNTAAFDAVLPRVAE